MFEDTILISQEKLVWAGLSLLYCLTIRGSTGGLLLLRDFSGVVSQPSVSGCHNTLFLSSSHL